MVVSYALKGHTRPQAYPSANPTGDRAVEEFPGARRIKFTGKHQALEIAFFPMSAYWHFVNIII